jgi:hypothetical protein
MALLSPNVYDLISHFHNTAQPQDKWSVTTTFYSPTTPTATDAIITAIRAYLQVFARPDSTLASDACYNWSRGANVYPAGLPVFTSVLNMTGTANSSSWPSSLTAQYVPAGAEVVFVVAKNTNGRSRPGRNFFRGFLGKAEIQAATGGKWVLVPSLSGMQTDLNAIESATGLAVYVGNIPNTAPHLVVQPYSKKHGTVGIPVPVVAQAVIGASTSKLNRRNKR